MVNWIISLVGCNDKTLFLEDNRVHQAINLILQENIDGSLYHAETRIVST